MSFFDSIGSAIGNIVQGVGNTISNGVKGVGEVLSGNVSQGLKDIAPAALLGAGAYYGLGLGGAAASTAPATVGAGTAGLAGADIAAGMSGITGTSGLSTLPTTVISSAPAIPMVEAAASGLSALPQTVIPASTAIPTITAGTAATGGALSSLLPSALTDLLPTTPAGMAALGQGAASLASGLIGANATQNAAQIQANAAQAASQNQLNMFNTLNAQNAPYRAQGYNALNVLGSGLPGTYTQYDATGKPIGTAQGTGYLTQQFGPNEFAANIDPGYAFRLQQGQMATQRAANQAGGLIGGNALKGMQDYTQGLASTEYSNAFNRFQTQRGNIFNTLASIAGIGQASQGQANQLGTNLATAQGQLGVGSAAAQAAGQIGTANALGGVATGVGNAFMLSQLLGQNQSVAGIPLYNSNGSPIIPA